MQIEKNIQPLRKEGTMQIEKNIPVPSKGRWGQLATFKLIAEQMEIGDSVLFENRTEASKLYQAIRNLGSLGTLMYTKDNPPYDATTRKEKNGIRVWRIK